MKAYDLALMLLIFGAMVGFLNGLNLGTDMPASSTQNASDLESDVKEVEGSVESWGANPFGFFMAMSQGANVLISTFTGLFAVSVILYSYGLPIGFCAAVQGIVYFVYLVGLAQFISGRYVER